MLCVKEERDLARAMSTLVENEATSYAFLEVGFDELMRHTNETYWDKVYYVLNIGSFETFNSFVAAPKELQQRSFLVEVFFLSL
jgi:hypothetical protein